MPVIIAENGLSEEEIRAAKRLLIMRIQDKGL
jgi:hypothetical protein